MKLESKLEGFDDFSRLLRELPRNVENRVVDQATVGAMRAALPFMKAAAPVDIDDRSPSSKKYGRLKTNIRVKKLRRVAKGQKAARITTGKAFWGFIYEKGSRHQPARPWFTPAFNRAQQLILKALGIKIGEGIEREVAKLMKGGKK